VLAAASAAIALRDDDAAAILNNLRGDSGATSPPAFDFPKEPGSPCSESTTATQAAPRVWQRHEDELLRHLVSKAQPQSAGRRGSAHNGSYVPDASSWADIAAELDGRTPMQCMERWQKVLNADNVKGPWCPTEDAQLVELVEQYGGKHWARIASMLPGRTGKQCRERWCNNLDPTLKKGSWTPEEDMIILEMHAKLGTRWAEIAKSLPGRSDNSVKNRWYSTCSRIMRQQQEAAPGFEPASPLAHAPSTMAICGAGEATGVWPKGLPNSLPPTPSTPSIRRFASQSSGTAFSSTASPGVKRKLSGGNGMPTSQKSPGMMAGGHSMVALVSHLPDSCVVEQDWKVGTRLPRPPALALPDGWLSLAVRLPQPGELRAAEPLLSAELF